VISHFSDDTRGFHEGQERYGEVVYESSGFVDVPGPACSVLEIHRFALTFDGYARGGFVAAAEVANPALSNWFADGSLPEDLDELRTCLFFEQRRHRHMDSGFGGPADPNEPYLRALIEKIREVSGGRVKNERRS
jgi:hypothetical protein